jgi:hypothetical protein
LFQKDPLFSSTLSIIIIIIITGFGVSDQHSRKYVVIIYVQIQQSHIALTTNNKVAKRHPKGCDTIQGIKQQYYHDFNEGRDE